MIGECCKNQNLGYPDPPCYLTCLNCGAEDTGDSNREEEKIYQVCSPCGVAANVLTCLRKYGRSPKKLHFDISTFRKAKCDICGDITSVTEVRDFFYPDFRLLIAEMQKSKKHKDG